MSCSSPGSTHHMACDCRESEWAAKLDAAEARIRSLESAAAAREAEVQAHMEARYEAEERVRLLERRHIEAEARVRKLEGWVADEVLWLQSSATFGPLDRLARIQALLAPPTSAAPERKEENRG